EDGIRDFHVTGVQTCTLPICTQNVSISATATGFTSANLNVQVTDNDANPALTLSAISSTISETNGATTATVSRSGNNTQPLVVRSEERRVGKEGKCRWLQCDR